ncbi:hypothetical protein RND71_002122 [Anisodus tanguticus]|uniref:Uncharacterized protein n=1 Tax=Anisodus tanguticus TaxID=243964 RepID=A0AAE1VYV6_9SOLA|nr:hypothetical protein RND71_002122 [Anisodus tanguticus]
MAVGMDLSGSLTFVISMWHAMITLRVQSSWLRQHKLDFDKMRDHGSDTTRFAELIISYGLVCNGDSLFDRGYEFIWEFNFCDFNVARDDHALGSIELLCLHKLDFDNTRDHGADIESVRSWLFPCGLSWERKTYLGFDSISGLARLPKELER